MTFEQVGERRNLRPFRMARFLRLFELLGIAQEY